MSDSFEIEFDEELGEIQDIDLDVIKPYMYEPIRAENRAESSEESESDDSHEEYEIDENENEMSADQWCSCGQCHAMPTARECLCCKSVSAVDFKTEEANLNCITEHESFIANCLNRHVLETSYYEYIQDHGQLEDHQEIHEVYRYIAYRRFTRWIWRILGKRNRRILPSCVVTKISDHFPSQQYCGFKYPA